MCNMLNYVENLEDFLSSAEATITREVKTLLTDEEVDREALLCLYGLMELVDQLPSMSNADKELVISYLLDKYNIIEGVASPFNTLSDTGLPTGSNGPVYWDDIIGKPVSTPIVFEEDIVVSLSGGKTIGQYVNGDIIPSAGKTPEQVIKLLAIEEIYPTYTGPSASINSTVTGYREVGSTVTPSITFSFTQNDAGALSLYELFRGGATKRSDSSLPIDTSAYSDSFVVPLGVTTYTGNYGWETGVLKNSTPSNTPYPTGQITAATSALNALTVSGVFPWFCGSESTDTLPSIYTGTKTVAPATGTLSVNSFGSGTKFLWFAVPSGSKVFTTWNRTALDNGNIGGGTNLFKSPITISVTSTGLTTNWTQDYDLYFSNYATDASVATTLN